MMRPIDMLYIIGCLPSDRSSGPRGVRKARWHQNQWFNASSRLHPNRAPFEFYPTPPDAVRALLSVERFSGSVWEPACGDGRIAREFIAKGYHVVASDLVDYGYGQPATDFLQQQHPLARNIVTNPPYGGGLADRFVDHAIKLCDQTGGTVAMLLNIASLCHPSRHDSFIRKPPARIWALDKCVCYPNGDPAQATRHTHHHRYCWLVWTPGRPRVTNFGWLSTAPFKSDSFYAMILPC